MLQGNKTKQKAKQKPQIHSISVENQNFNEKRPSVQEVVSQSVETCKYLN